MLFALFLLFSSSTYAQTRPDVVIEVTKSPDLQVTFFTAYRATNPIRECQTFVEGSGGRSGHHPHWAQARKYVTAKVSDTAPSGQRITMKSKLNDFCGYEMYLLPQYSVSVPGKSRTPAQHTFGQLGKDSTSADGKTELECSFPVLERFECKSTGTTPGSEKSNYRYDFKSAAN